MEKKLTETLKNNDLKVKQIPQIHSTP